MFALFPVRNNNIMLTTQNSENVSVVTHVPQTEWWEIFLSAKTCPARKPRQGRRHEKSPYVLCTGETITAYPQYL